MPKRIHLCSAFYCPTEIADREYFCERHWQGVSMDTRREIHAAGSKRAKGIDGWVLELLKAVNAARLEIMAWENRPPGEIESRQRQLRKRERLHAQTEIRRLKERFAEKNDAGPPAAAEDSQRF